MKNFLIRHTSLNIERKIRLTESLYFFTVCFFLITAPNMGLFLTSTLIGFMVGTFGFFYMFKSFVEKSDTPVLDFIFASNNFLYGTILFLMYLTSFSVFITFFAVLFFLRSVHFIASSTILIQKDILGGILGYLIAILSLLGFFWIIFNPIFIPGYGTELISGILFLFAMLNFVILYRINYLEKKIKK